MDLNLFVVSGRLAAPPEIRVAESGSTLARYLVTAATQEPHRRLDVLPVVLWDPPETLTLAPGLPGQQVWACGAVQRRFWIDGDARRSRLELIAHSVELRAGVATDEAQI